MLLRIQAYWDVPNIGKDVGAFGFKGRGVSKLLVL
jgi:hypothetical protein